MAELQFFSGTMETGKSTMALQVDFTLRSRGLLSRRYTHLDRNGSVISSRMGVSADAIEVTPHLDLFADIRQAQPLDFVICDEAQFYQVHQIDQLAAAVDQLGIDVYAFGVLTDFKGRLFPGSRRLLELADRRLELPVAALCWCSRRATHNARIVDGKMVTAGRTVSIDATYQPLCRRHYLEQLPAPSPRRTRRRKPAST